MYCNKTWSCLTISIEKTPQYISAILAMYPSIQNLVVVVYARIGAMAGQCNFFCKRINNQKSHRRYLGKIYNNKEDGSNIIFPTHQVWIMLIRSKPLQAKTCQLILFSDWWELNSTILATIIWRPKLSFFSLGLILKQYFHPR